MGKIFNGEYMLNEVNIAAVQMDPKLGKAEENMQSIVSSVREAANNHAKLIVFPECSLTGYIFTSRSEALAFAESIPGESTESLIDLCKELDTYLVVGLLEKEANKLYNAAALLGPEGLIGSYRKNHLPFLGVDRFVDPGNKPFDIYKTPIGNIGLYICYDVLFPESSRIMTLLGADILALPTNFPGDVGDLTTNCVIRVRAFENKVYVVAADRVGTERGCSFAGMSKIVDCSGNVLESASSDKEEIIYGNINLESARQKHVISVPGESEVNPIADRRPELYGMITRPNPDVG